MVVVYLNYLPSFMRVAVFMSAALGKLPPSCHLSRNLFVVECSSTVDLYQRGQVTCLACADSKTEY